ncbi:hypothetical protein FHX15_006060 [Rhizobium sp. BK650]|nr:hypothetical protein [Rhizobium sp. BK650]
MCWHTGQEAPIADDHNILRVCACGTALSENCQRVESSVFLRS